jgi:hypothetical protein
VQPTSGRSPSEIRVERTTLSKPSWPCSACGAELKRGDPIKITITPFGGPNRVEHDPDCGRTASAED